MNDLTHETSSINSMLEYLEQVSPERRTEIGAQLARAGITAGTQPASGEVATSLPPDPVQASKLRKIALLTLAVTSLGSAVERFQPLKLKIQKRLRKVELLRLWSAIITSILSSTVVGSLGLGGEKTWSILLGFLALAASLLTLVATRQEGGAKMSEEFGEANAKCEAAIQLRDRLQMYKDAPELFDDTEGRLKEAETLVTFLTDKLARWSLTLS